MFSAREARLWLIERVRSREDLVRLSGETGLSRAHLRDILNGRRLPGRRARTAIRRSLRPTLVTKPQGALVDECQLRNYLDAVLGDLGPLRIAALELQVNKSTLAGVATGHRKMPPKLARALGYEPITMYERQPK